MPISPYRPCDPKNDLVGCFVYPDIINRVDQFLPPIVSEAAQNTLPPPRSYDIQFVVNPSAGAGRVGGLMHTFERRAAVEPYLRVIGRPIHTSPNVAAMTAKFADARRGLSWGSPVYLPVLSGDGGLSKVLDALSRLPEQANSNVVVVPVNGVGTARDIPRLAGAPSFTERLPHAFMRSVRVPYRGVDVEGDVGAGRHFHSIAFGVGGKLFQIVHDVVEERPYLLKLKKISSVFGVVPYLVAFVPLFNMVRKGELIAEVEIMQGDQVLFRGKTCGIITAIVPGMGSVSRIPGVDPTHGQVKLLILPEHATQALSTALEGMSLWVKSLIPGTTMPETVASIPADRQITLGQDPVRLRFSTPSPMEANGDYVGDATTLTMKVAEKPVAMLVNRDSVLAKLAGYQDGNATLESVLRFGEVAMLGAGLVGAIYPQLSAEAYRDLTHKMMVGMVHGTSIAIMLRRASPLAFHLRLLSLLPAFLVLQKASEFLPISTQKWQIFAQNYLPLAAMGAMQYFRITPSVGNVVRLVAPAAYSNIMGGRLATGMARGTLGRLVSGIYTGAYAAGVIVYIYHSIGDLGERNRIVSSWLESTLESDSPRALAAWSRGVLTLIDAEPAVVDAIAALPLLPGAEVEAALKDTLPSEDWTKLDQLADRMHRLDLNTAQDDAKKLFELASSPNEIVARAWMMAARVDPAQAYWHRALLRALIHHDYDIVSAAENPGMFVTAATLAFHRRHGSQSPMRVMPDLLAFLTSDNN